MEITPHWGGTMPHPHNMSDEEFWRICEPIINKALAEVNAAHPKVTPVSKALQALMGRIVDSVHTLIVIAKYQKGQPNLDSCAILRACYDAFIQAAWIVNDPATATDLANDFLDFYYIERHKFWKKLQASGATMMKARLMNSPLRPAAEPVLNAEFDRVKHRFEVKREPGKPVKYRDNWYKGNLSQLAEKTGWADEYNLILASLHSSVHSGIYAITNKGAMVLKDIPFMAQCLVFRIIKRIGSFHGVQFKDNDVVDLVDGADESVLQ
jgi:hypothetical protein